MPKKIERWMTSDGTFFSTEKEAISYEYEGEKCPICNGKGLIKGFLNTNSSLVSEEEIGCNCCHGTGIISKKSNKNNLKK